MKKYLMILFVTLFMVAGLITPVLAGAQNLKVSTPWMAIEDAAPGAVVSGMLGTSYPNSQKDGWGDCANGMLLRGTIITGVKPTSGKYEHCWNWGTDNASHAFDGDKSTFFDPFEAGQQSWCGMLMSQPFRLTEVRICTRPDFDLRIYGAAVQGSNDNGATWHTIVYIDPAKFTDSNGEIWMWVNDYYVFTPQRSEQTIKNYTDAGWPRSMADFSSCWADNGAYTMFRYVNINSEHADVAEVELYGVPADNSITFTGKAASTVKGSISGFVIGAGGFWVDGVHEYEEAWDGKSDTFYDPREPGMNCWTGIAANTAYELSEVRVLPRMGFFERTEGALIQGSNDGKTWTTLARFTAADCLKEGTPQTYITKKVIDKNRYSLFRYINDGSQHGDVADVILVPASGQKTIVPGQVIGQVLATDIRAFINGAEIPSYNIDGKLAILISDLNNYGFKTTYNNDLRKSSVTRVTGADSFTSVTSKATGLPVGTPVMSVYSTDIVVELNGVQVQAFNVDNRMAIYFTELKKYGDVIYDNTTRTSKLTLSKGPF